MKTTFFKYRISSLILFAFLFTNVRFLHAQAFLNGNFENNTAVNDQINLSNVMFNGFMSNTNAFGTFGNMDIISSSTWGGGGAQNGTWYVALTGNGTDMIAMTLNAPLIAGNTYCISFYDRKDPGYQAFPIRVGLSANNNTFGSTIYTAPVAATNNTWIQRSFTFVAPINGQYITVMQSAGSTGDWVHIDNFTFTASVPANVLGNDTTLCSFPYVLNATTPGATYLWNNGSTQPTISINGPGVYWVDITAGCGTLRDSITIQSGNTLVNLGNDTAICGSMVLNATTPGATYLWSNNATTPTITVNTPGTYWVEVSVGACVGRDTIVISQAQAPPVNLGNDTAICAGSTITLNATTLNATYLWSNNATTPTITVSTGGTYWVEVNVGGCIGRDTIIITQVNAPPVNLGNDTTICNGNSVTLNAFHQLATGYLWSDGSTQAQVQISNPGTYWVTVFFGPCVSRDTIVINAATAPPGNFLADASVCAGQQATLQAPPGYVAYLWSTGATTSSIQVAAAGSYWVNVSNGSCSTYDTCVVTILPAPSVQLPLDSVPLCGDSTLLIGPSSTDPSYTYSWNNGANTQQLSISMPGVYILTATNNCGSDGDTVIVTRKNCECYLYLPNTFTPNGDGINEEFGPGYDCEIREYEFMIFNRWGELLFRSKHPDFKWTGMVNGDTKAPMGIYVYYLRYENQYIQDGFKEMRGFVNLVR